MKVAKIEKRTMPIEDLIPHPRNPRLELKPNMPEYKKLRKSLLKFDYIDPIIWNEATGHVVGGHQRLTILKAEGYTAVDVSVVNIPNEYEEMALVVALNKIEGQWDNTRLAEIFSTMEPEMEVLTGFEKMEIDNLLTTLPDFDPEKEYKGMPEFNSEKIESRSIIIHFENQEDVDSFAALLGQNITDRTKFLWYPYKAKEDKRKTRFASDMED